MKATFDAKTGELTLVMPCDSKVFVPAEEGKVYDMVFTSGGFQPTAITDAEGRPLRVQVMGGYVNAARKAASAAARKNGK